MRNVTVSSVNFHQTADNRQGLSLGVSYVKKALPAKPDIIVLPEAFCSTVQTAETVPGPITDTFAAIARDNGCYIVVPQYQKDGDRIFNASVLIDRSGKISAIYHKLYPTDYEIASGVTPGQENRAYETDFGRIGLAICFDMNFSEIFDKLAKDGAEAVFFSSAYEGRRQLSSRALEHSMYIISAHWGGLGYIVDKNGRVLDRSHSWRTPVITRAINFDRYVFHLDYNSNYLDEITREYGAKIQIDPDASECIFTMSSTTEDIDILDIKQRYGLEFFCEYLNRSRKIREASLQVRDINRFLREDRP